MTKAAQIKVVDWEFDEAGRIQVNQIQHMQKTDMPDLGEDHEVHMSLLGDSREISKAFPKGQGRK